MKIYLSRTRTSLRAASQRCSSSECERIAKKLLVYSSSNNTVHYLMYSFIKLVYRPFLAALFLSDAAAERIDNNDNEHFRCRHPFTPPNDSRLLSTGHFEKGRERSNSSKYTQCSAAAAWSRARERWRTRKLLRKKEQFIHPRNRNETRSVVCSCAGGAARGKRTAACSHTDTHTHTHARARARSLSHTRKT